MIWKKLTELAAGQNRSPEFEGLLTRELREIWPDAQLQDVERIAAIAGLLGKVAFADLDISEVEWQRIEEILSAQLKLKRQEIDIVRQLLTEQRVQLFAVEDYLYTRFLSEILEKSEKLELLQALFSIAAADESVGSDEDAAIWTVAKGLKLAHREFIAVRAKFRDKLDILKKGDER